MQETARRLHSAVCAGGCGRTIHRCRSEKPVCQKCKGRTLTPSRDRPPVILRKRQVAEYLGAVARIIAACVRRWADAHGTRPNRGQRRRVERRVLRCLARRGVPTCFTLLPLPGTSEWRVILAVLERVEAGVCRVGVR